MRLKKLEIQGFKSFAYKTEVKIKDGITAIVGPNGSGKSNISDAIRWVLGEQSVKNLRGSKMEDVIFAGTSKKKPLGYCEVTITFDNTSGMIPLDYLEVAVTRRMFRSGESEYYLNKNSCRLKDIRELFMDTGIGKDGYSIIGQGRIEEILSNRPEDRRSIFEEAAGIVKYKAKKIEAEKKLEKTEDNIIRIKDLVFELSKQLEVLEGQAEKANQFTKLHNKLKELEVNLFIMDIRKLNAEIEKIKKEKSLLESELEIETCKNKEIEENFNKIKLKIDELENQIEKYRNENLNAKNQMDKNSNDLSILKEKENFYNKDLDRLNDEEESLNKKLKELKDSEIKTNKNIKKFEEEYNGLFDIYKENKIKLDKEDSLLKEKEKEIDNEKNNIIKIYNKSSDTQSQLNSITSFNENINKRIQQLNKEINSRNEKREEVSNNHKEEILRGENLKKDLTSLNEKYKNSQIVADNANNKILSLMKEININNNEIGSKLSSLKLLENMEEDYEGYYKGVKSILIRSKKDKQIKDALIGVVAELFHVHPKYEKAIEMALGSNSQNIVTPTEYHAKTLIEYLKTNRLGRITCLPHNIIKSNTIKLIESDKKEFKIVGLGHELINFNEKYENIFKYLIGRTIVIEDIDSAIKFANKYNHSHRIITLQGEVLNPGGSMSGGSNYKNKINIINRKSRISELKDEIKSLKKLQEELEQEKNGCDKKKENLDKEIETLKKQIKDIEHYILICENNKEKYLNEISMIEQIITKSKEEVMELESEESNYKNKEKELKNFLIELEEDVEKQKQKVHNLTINYNEKKSENEEELKGLTDIKIKISESENNIKNLKEKFSLNKMEIESILKNLQEKSNLIIETEEKLKELESDKSNLIVSIEELKKLEEDTKKNLNSIVENKNNYMNEFYSQQDSLMKINKDISSKEKTINFLEVKLTRNSVQLENYHKKLLDDYELDFQEALKYETKIENIKETIVLVRRLKTDIKELGNVNLSSIEEYKTLKERLDFILSQQKDLTNARKTLREVIEDMEVKMKNEFLINFNKINKNFKEIFKILFNGGEADLVLESKDDILNSGIDIHAQPPGKKLQSLSLLSGGEKSLTAVALLFSILNLKPAPFCILDEIDAALDEANISKYTSYLKTLSHDTQFVLITHRKTTMEIVDVLYGVAMEEEGISKLISVELKDYIKEIAS